VCPVKYELGFYIPEDDILHCDSRENLKPTVRTRVIMNCDVLLGRSGTCFRKKCFPKLHPEV
jgi:hypothetical protein